MQGGDNTVSCLQKKKPMLNTFIRAVALLMATLTFSAVASAQKKAVFIILDGISADVLEKESTPVLDEIAAVGGYTRAYQGGNKDTYNESPTISAPGYNNILTGTWSNKHNVWDNKIAAPNYHYWNIFRIAKTVNPKLKTAIFSTWLDNRTKLVGEDLPEAGNFKFDYAFDGFENDHQRFPHTKDRKFIFAIDEHVSKEAARVIEEHGPDLSWVYLEFTDDMGHMYGDSPEYFDAVRKADVQVGRIWNAIEKRQQQQGEEWMIVVTTDHGRKADTGKDHGGQSERERTTWIATNIRSVNQRFRQNPAAVDIMPSILRFMDIEIPREIQQEVDGVPFVGEVSVANLKATRSNNQIALQWDVLDSSGKAEIFITTTNHFKHGQRDEYVSVGKVNVSKGKYTFRTPADSEFFKIVMRAPGNGVNTWVVGE